MILLEINNNEDDPDENPSARAALSTAFTPLFQLRTGDDVLLLSVAIAMNKRLCRVLIIT